MSWSYWKARELCNDHGTERHVTAIEPVSQWQGNETIRVVISLSLSFASAGKLCEPGTRGLCFQSRDEGHAVVETSDLNLTFASKQLVDFASL